MSDHSDDWRTHFRDTMRGGKFLNHWRMAQLHAQEAPDRIRELERSSTLFDQLPTADSFSERSAATPISGSATWATALAWR